MSLRSLSYGSADRAAPVQPLVAPVDLGGNGISTHPCADGSIHYNDHDNIHTDFIHHNNHDNLSIGIDNSWSSLKFDWRRTDFGVQPSVHERQSILRVFCRLKCSRFSIARDSVEQWPIRLWVG